MMEPSPDSITHGLISLEKQYLTERSESCRSDLLNALDAMLNVTPQYVFPYAEHIFKEWIEPHDEGVITRIAVTISYAKPAFVFSMNDILRLLSWLCVKDQPVSFKLVRAICIALKHAEAQREQLPFDHVLRWGKSPYLDDYTSAYVNLGEEPVICLARVLPACRGDPPLYVTILKLIADGSSQCVSPSVPERSKDFVVAILAREYDTCVQHQVDAFWFNVLETLRIFLVATKPTTAHRYARALDLSLRFWHKFTGKHQESLMIVKHYMEPPPKRPRK